MEGLKIGFLDESRFVDFSNWHYNYKNETIQLNTSDFFKVIVIEKEDEFLGFTSFNFVSSEVDIIDVFVRKEHRGKSIATKMFEVLMDFAKEENVESVILEVAEDNYNAISLYEKFMFKKIFVRKKYYNNKVDAIVMVKELAVSS